MTNEEEMNKQRLTFSIGWLVIFLLLFLLSPCLAQNDVVNSDQYQIGSDERLIITVHIFGEIKNPGEYLVPDNTNILELISKAGGPTEFSNMSKVKITRGLISINDLKKVLHRKFNNRNYKNKGVNKQIIKINLKKMLDDRNSMATLPILQPGDVIRVGRNAWFTWQVIIRIISQLAVVAQVWYWYNKSY